MPGLLALALLAALGRAQSADPIGALSAAQRAWLLDVSANGSAGAAPWTPLDAAQTAALAAGAAEAQAVFEETQLRHGAAVDMWYETRGNRSSAATKYDDVGDSLCWTGSAVAAWAHQAAATGDAAALARVTDTLRMFQTWSGVTPRARYMPRYVGPSDDAAYFAYYDGSKLAHNTSDGQTWLGSESRDQYLGLAYALSATLGLLQDEDATELAVNLSVAVVEDLVDHDWFIFPAVVGDLPIRSDPIFLAVWARLGLSAGMDVYKTANLSSLYSNAVAAAAVVDFHLTAVDADGYFGNNLDVMALYSMALLEPKGTPESARLLAALADIGAGYGAQHLMPTFAVYALAAGALADSAAGQDVATGLTEGLLLDFPASKWELAVNSSALYPHSDKDDAMAAYAMLPSDRPFDTFMWQRTPAKLAGGSDKAKEYQWLDLFLPYWVGVSAGVFPVPASTSTDDPVDVVVDLDAPGAPMARPWLEMVGSGHAKLALRDDWRQHMAAAAQELGIRTVRFHGVLDDDMGVVAAPGQFDWTSVDSVLDFLTGADVQAQHVFLELSFMPAALASGEDTFLQYQANVSPPRSLAEWGALVEALAAHVLQRYPADVTFTLECWNEPNLANQPVVGGFWAGSQADYFALYNATAWAARAADPAAARLRVGGPATSAGGWLDEFVAFVGEAGAPLDFLSTHAYPTDQGAGDRDALPEAVDAAAAVAAAAGVPLIISETNTGLFGLEAPLLHVFDSPESATFVARNAPRLGAAEAVSWWAVSDVFEERLPVDSAPVEFLNRYGLLTVDGVRKPVFRALELLAGLSDVRLSSSSSSDVVEAWAVDGAVVVTNWDSPTARRGPAAAVRVQLQGFEGDRVVVRRIDSDHCNPRQAWEAMGAPARPSAAQLEVLHAASEVPASEVAVGGDNVVELSVPAQGMAVVYF